MKRDFLICLSFVNVAFSRAWIRVLNPISRYYLSSAWQNAVLVLASVLVISIASFGLLRWLRRRLPEGRTRSVASIVLLISIVSVTLPSVDVLVFMVIVLALLRIMFNRFSILQWSSTFSLICAPFILLTFGQTIGMVIDSRTAHNEIRSVRSAGHAREGVPVLWIIFDELDEDAAFEQRPVDLNLPAFDEFKTHSWSAQNAYPPTNFTELSIPSITTGKFVADAKPLSSGELLLRFSEGNNYLRWSEQDSIFREAHALGFNTSVVGWYHPYCEVFKNELNDCFQVQSDISCYGVKRGGLLASIASELRLTFPTSQLLLHREDEDNIARRFHIDEYQALNGAVVDAVNRFDSGLLYVHLPVPHPNGIYDRKSGEFSVDKRSNYFDNLALADHMLNEIKTTMIERGMWESTAVIVSSDHWWRVKSWSNMAEWTNDEEEFRKKTDHRIPFLVKLPRQNDSVIYPLAFNTVISRKLVIPIMQGQVKSSADLSALVSATSSLQRTIAPIYREYR